MSTKHLSLVVATGDSGAARRHRERRLRSWAKHERLSVAMALAEALHHNTGPSTKRVVARREEQEEVENETHNAPRVARRSMPPPSPGWSSKRRGRTHPQQRQCPVLLLAPSRASSGVVASFQRLEEEEEEKEKEEEEEEEEKGEEVTEEAEHEFLLVQSSEARVFLHTFSACSWTSVPEANSAVSFGTECVRTTGRCNPTEADTRHIAMELRGLGLEKLTPVVTPVASPKSEELLLLACAKLLNAEDSTLYRSVTMRVNHLDSGPSRLVIRCSLSGTRDEDSHDERPRGTKRVGRFLRGRKIGTIVLEPQTLLGVLEVFCDADHAGDLGTRKPRSGMAVMWGSHLINHGGAVQSTMAPSSGESEYYALLRSPVHALGIKTMLHDGQYGVKCEKNVRCDCSAARGMSARQGTEENSTC